MPRKETKSKSSKKRSRDEEEQQQDSDASIQDFAGSASDEELGRAQDRLKQAKSYLADLAREAKKPKPQLNENENDDDDDESGIDEASLDFGEIDAEEIDKEIIASRLQRDTLVSRGRAFESIAQTYENREYIHFKCNTPDGKVPTCCVFGPSNLVYLTTKGNCVYQYRYEEASKSLRKLHTFRAEVDSFYSLAVSGCGGYLVAGSKSGRIVVWSVKSTSTTSSAFTYKQIGVLTQHRGPVLALAFTRDASNTFYSASTDRTVKIWSLESGDALYIDTLYGHQDSVQGLAALGKDVCVSVGCRDRTARLWKVAEETQLVFRGPEASGGSQELVSMIDEGSFVSGTDLGAVSLWNTRRKKPLVTQFDANPGSKPVCALATFPYTDLLASGGADGYLKLWRAAPAASELLRVRQITLDGFINSLAWNDSAALLAAVTGREQRLGRWESIKSAKNQLHIFIFADNE